MSTDSIVSEVLLKFSKAVESQTALLREMFGVKAREANTFTTPTVRVTTEQLVGLIDESLAGIAVRAVEVDAKVKEQAAFLARAKEQHLAIHEHGHTAMGGNGPAQELIALGQRKEFLEFTKRHLATGAVFEIDADRLHNFLNGHVPSGYAGIGRLAY